MPPIVGEPTNGEAVADPIPQALILTSIVISLAVSTFLLAMAYRNYTADQEPGARGRPDGCRACATADLGGGDE